MMQERRKYVRVPNEYILRCDRFKAEDLFSEHPSQLIKAVVKNVSAGGILFESSHSFDMGTLLKLEIDIPGWERFKAEFYKEDATSRSRPLLVLAQVVRVEAVAPDNNFDIGVCFVAIDEGHRWALMKYLQHPL